MCELQVGHGGSLTFSPCTLAEASGDQGQHKFKVLVPSPSPRDPKLQG